MLSKYKTMKYVVLLTETEEITLLELMKNHNDHRTKMRSHAILLSHDKFCINDISKIFRVDRDTVSLWFSNWMQKGVAGLFDIKRSGRPPLLSKEEKNIVLDCIESEPRNVKKVVADLKKNRKRSKHLYD